MTDCKLAHKKMLATIAKFNKSCEGAVAGELNAERIQNIREMIQVFKEIKVVSEPHQ